MHLHAYRDWIGIGLFALAAVSVILLRKHTDWRRIRAYFAGRGERLVYWSWFLFGTGWPNDLRDRYYDIRYLDAEGHLHIAKWKIDRGEGKPAEDRIVRRAEPIPLLSERRGRK